MISRTTSSGTTLAYPIYDAHGNNVGLISRNGANYAVSQERSYDAWGAIRSGIKDTTKLTYCANLGHKEDDESGLIYMRARYYEPSSGRFISEDPARDGFNWYIYCDNSPVNMVDETGKAPSNAQLFHMAGMFFALVAMYNIRGYPSTALNFSREMASLACGFFALALLTGVSDFDRKMDSGLFVAVMGFTRGFISIIGQMTQGAMMGSKTRGQAAVALAFMYSLQILGYLVAEQVESAGE